MSVPDRLGDFEIVAEIGRGGFGIVYRARQVSLHRDVALKVLYEHRVHTREEVGRFEREARAAARLDHPAIVSVFAWGQDKGHFFIAQKLVGEGRTLADQLAELKAGGEPPKGYFRQVADSLARVADGLQHAHDEGIVHRDMKPSNILLDEKSRPFLGDFGLAKLEDGLELSRTGDFAGSPYYMSPEQADSKRGEVDHRADIYGLGVTLYELLTLEPPFLGRSPHEIMRKILTEDPRLPSKIAPRVPKDLETIALHAMEKQRSRRYQSAQEFAADLRAFLQGEPIKAVPVSTLIRVWRSARRNRSGVGIVVLVAALLAVTALLQKEASDGKQAEQRAELTKDVVSTASSLGAEKRAEVDAQFITAMSENRTDDAVKLQAFKEDVSRWLESGQTLLMDVIPDISDKQTLQEVGENLQGQFLYNTVKQVEDYLKSHGTDGSPDPRLALASDWLQNADWLSNAATSLNLTLGDLLAGGTSTPQIKLSTVGDAAATALLATPPGGPGGVVDQVSELSTPGDGPPLGPAGVLSPARPGATRRLGPAKPAKAAAEQAAGAASGVSSSSS